MKMNKENEMLKFEVSELKEFSVDELKKIMLVDYSDFSESGVYKIGEDVSKVEVIDGVFEVESVEEFKERVLSEYKLYKDGEIINLKEIEEYREELDEWVYVEMVEGIVSMCESEESGYDIVKLVID